MAEIKYIPVSKLWRHPDNPRKDLGDVTELAESIKVNGVLQNLTVVPLIGEITKKWDGESYRVIIGHRRLAAAKLAGLDVYISSNVPKGSGVSSSAAFASCICTCVWRSFVEVVCSSAFAPLSSSLFTIVSSEAST